MANNEPNWDDLHNRAKAAGDDGFEDVFNEGMKEEAGAKKGADGSDEEKKRKAEQKKQERKERKENLEELFAMYEKLANATGVEDIFEEFGFLTGKELERSIEKKFRNELSKKFNTNNFTGGENVKKEEAPFSKETVHISTEVFVVLTAFYNEAICKAKNPHSFDRSKERERISRQDHIKAIFESDILAARKAEDVFSADDEEPEQEGAEEKRETGGAESTNDGSAEGPGGSEKNESGEAKAEPGESGAGGKGPEGGEGVGAEGSEDDRENGEQKDHLLTELENARFEYVKSDYENRNKWNGIRKFFGFKGKEEMDEVRMLRERYEQALDDYRHGKIEEMRNSGFSSEELKKEMSDLMMMFKYGEVINLVDARNDAKLESMKDTTWGKIRSVPTKIANAYNKIPLWGKLAISGAAFVSGSVAFISGKRILGGIVTGVGLAKGYEALDQKRVQKRAGKEIEMFMQKIESPEVVEEDKFKHLNEILNKELVGKNGVVERTQNMISRRNRSKAIAIAAGGVLVSLGMGKLAEALTGDEVAQAKGIIDYEKFKVIFGLGEQLSPENVNPLPGSSFLLEQEISSGPIAQGLKEVAVGAQGTGIHLEVASGSGKGIEHMLIEALKQKGVENPGAVAHRMVLEYADNNDLTVDKLSHIKSASFDIEPGGENGFRIKDLKFDALKGYAGHVSGGENIGQNANYAETTDTRVPFPNNPFKEIVPGAVTQGLNEVAVVAYENADYAIPETGDADFVKFAGEMRITNGDFREIAKASAKEITGGNFGKWQLIKDISCNDIIKQNDLKPRFIKLLTKYENLLGKEAIIPQGNGEEKIGHYIGRLSIMASKKCEDGLLEQDDLYKIAA